MLAAILNHQFDLDSSIFLWGWLNSEAQIGQVATLSRCGEQLHRWVDWHSQGSECSPGDGFVQRKQDISKMFWG